MKLISRRSGRGKEPKLTQSTSKVSKTNRGQIHPIDQNLPLSGLHESEERQRKSTLSRTGSAEDANLSPCSVSLNDPRACRKAQFTYLLSGVDLERKTMKHVWQLRLEGSSVGAYVEPLRHRELTEYRITRSLHSMRPAVGQDAGGRGSTNSGGSRSNSEYSLTRSTATLEETGEGRRHKHGISASPSPAQGQQTVGP